MQCTCNKKIVKQQQKQQEEHKSKKRGREEKVEERIFLSGQCLTYLLLRLRIHILFTLSLSLWVNIFVGLLSFPWPGKKVLRFVRMTSSTPIWQHRKIVFLVNVKKWEIIVLLLWVIFFVRPSLAFEYLMLSWKRVNKANLKSEAEEKCLFLLWFLKRACEEVVPRHRRERERHRLHWRGMSNSLL